MASLNRPTSVKITPSTAGQDESSENARPATSQRPASIQKNYPSTPNLATAARATLRARMNSADENKVVDATNHRLAPPINRNIFESPTIGVRKQKPRSPTRPVPFALKTLERASFRSKPESDNDRRIGMEEHLRPRRFKATEMPDFRRPVFCPALEKRTTEPKIFDLNTIRRAEERKVYEERLKQKEELNNEIRRQRDMDRERREQEEMQRLRAATVHRAQPVPQYKPFEISHDAAEQITIPHTPKFHTDRRLMERPPSRGAFL